MNEQTIEIRRTEPADYQAVQAILSQPKVIWGTLQVPFPSVEIWRKRMAEQPENLVGLVASVDGNVVGDLGLRMSTHSPRRRHAAQLGMAVHDKWQGRGIGSALLNAAIDLADRWLNLTRLELTVYTDNAAAIKLYKRAGFKVEGTLERYSFRDGEFADVYTMARLR